MALLCWELHAKLFFLKKIIDEKKSYGQFLFKKTIDEKEYNGEFRKKMIDQKH